MERVRPERPSTIIATEYCRSLLQPASISSPGVGRLPSTSFTPTDMYSIRRIAPMGTAPCSRCIPMPAKAPSQTPIPINDPHADVRRVNFEDMKLTPLYLNGQFVTPPGAPVTVIDPATE